MLDVKVGDILYGFCNGYFGIESYENKIVEAVGSDWIVAREVYSAKVVIAQFTLKLNAQHVVNRMISEWKHDPEN